MLDQKQKSKRFKAMHAGRRGFVTPNAWDAGSAIILAEAGAVAIGTTSAGIAFSLGKCDFHIPDLRLAVSREEMMERIKQIVGAVASPINADLEDGYGEAPKAVADTIEDAIMIGLAGGNIEDHNPRSGEGLYAVDLAVDRIRAAREAIDASGSSFVLNAKIDALTMTPETGLQDSIRRANLYLEAGADCVYPCGANDLETVATLVREIDGPVNIVTGWGSMRASTTALLDAGVVRVSLGGALARSALGYVRRCMGELTEHGTIGFAADQIPQSELNALFARRRLG